MIRRTTSSILTGALVALIPALLAAQSQQEVPRKHYSSPTGLTATDGLRIVIAPLPIRMPQGPSKLCDAEVTVEILDALDMQLLARFGPQPIGVGASYQADYKAAVGRPPTRQEVVVSAVLERKPFRTVERGTLPELCPLRASLQTYDLTTGRTSNDSFFDVSFDSFPIE
jgi:hypothetical protein